MTDELFLTVHVPADEWAYCNRRLAYLEALLLRIVRERAAFQEWYDAAELEGLRLPGLPPARQAIARKAHKEGWPRIRRGPRLAWHVTALPRRAFDALLARLIDLPELDARTDGLFALPPAPDLPPLPEDVAPPWILPLMRLMRSEARGDLARAWRCLPQHLPDGVTLPDVAEAAKVLATLKLF
ncbi:MAG: hypothetical protein LBE86_00900 [Gemmobacter sp.]|jgi:hypothetical protein|nr:hypothetical protein [Gemmobacter sp.]